MKEAEIILPALWQGIQSLTVDLYAHWHVQRGTGFLKCNCLSKWTSAKLTATVPNWPAFIWSLCWYLAIFSHWLWNPSWALSSFWFWKRQKAQRVLSAWWYVSLLDLGELQRFVSGFSLMPSPILTHLTISTMCLSGIGHTYSEGFQMDSGIQGTVLVFRELKVSVPSSLFHEYGRGMKDLHGNRL